MAATGSASPGSGGNPPNKGGRPADTREPVTIKLPAHDYAVLEYIEKRTALVPEEVARMLVHVAIRHTATDLVPDAMKQALTEGRALHPDPH